MNKLTSVVLKNSTIGLASQILIKFLSFGFSVFVIRRLGADAFGQYSGVIAFVTTFAFISDLGLSPYSVREIARLRDNPDGRKLVDQLYGNVISLRLLLSVFTIILVTVAAWLTDRPLSMVGAIGLNAMSLLLYSIQGGSEAVLSGYERVDIASMSKVFSQLAFVIAGTIVLVLSWGYLGLVVAGLLSLCVTTLICWNGARSLGLKPSLPLFSEWKKLLLASLPFGIITLALGLSYKFDTVLLTVSRGNIETGYYNAAYNLVFSAVLISNVINTSLYPSLSRHSIKSPEDLPKIYERMLRYLMAVSLPIAVGTWALAGQLVPFLFTADYLPSVLALQIVIWVVPFMFATEFLGYIVVIANQEKIVARSVVISTAFNIGLNLILVPRYGFIAAAMMTVLTEIILVGQYLWALRSQIVRINFVSGFLLPLGAAICMGLELILLRDQLGLFLSVGLGALSYLVFLVIFRVIGKDDLRFFRNIRPL